MPRDDDEWAMFVDERVEMNRVEGSIGRLFKHWINGQGAEPVANRAGP